MNEEKLEACPICSGDMFLNEAGELQCPNLVYHEMDPKLKKFFKGQWLGLPNIVVDLRWRGKPFSENQPICDACGKKVSGRDVERVLRSHNISYAAYSAQKAGEYNSKLTDLYEAIKKRKINLEEALRREEDLRKEYFNKPRQERPVSSISGSVVALKCPNCDKALGGIQVRVTALPENTPKAPTPKEWISLEMTAKQKREVKEHFDIEGSLKEWLKGEELKTLVGKIEVLRDEISHLSYVRTIRRDLNNFGASTYPLIKKIQSEIRTRSDQLYNFFKLPPAMVLRNLEERKRKGQEALKEARLKEGKTAILYPVNSLKILKEAFRWTSNLKISGFNVSGRAIHPGRTYHPDYPSVREYLESQLKRAAKTLSGKPLLLDHKQRVPGVVTASDWEEGWVEFVAEVRDPVVLDKIKRGVIKNCSIECSFKRLEKVNGMAPFGIEFTALSFLESLTPGDYLSKVEIWKKQAD